MPINPIVTDPNLSIDFPTVTRDEMAALIAEARENGAQVIESTPGDPSLEAVTFHKLLWTVQCVCYWDVATGLTVQVDKDSHRNVVAQKVADALAKIRSGA